jgi:hypothetical protein
MTKLAIFLPIMLKAINFPVDRTDVTLAAYPVVVFGAGPGMTKFAILSLTLVTKSNL